MVNRLPAEKFIFLHFAGAELRRGKQPGRGGVGQHFRLIHIIALGNGKLHVNALLGGVNLRHKSLLGRQELRCVNGVGAAGQREKSGQKVKEFFHIVQIKSSDGLNKGVVIKPY